MTMPCTVASLLHFFLLSAWNYQFHRGSVQEKTALAGFKHSQQIKLDEITGGHVVEINCRKQQ